MRNEQVSTIGMFLLVLVSLSVVSAAGFTMSIDTDLPNNVLPGNSYDLKVKFNNSNDSYSNVLVSFRGSDFDLPSNDTVTSGDVVTYDLSVDVPSNAENSFSRVLYADLFDGDDFIQTLAVTFNANIVDDSFCEDIDLSDNGDLEISGFTISNSGRGDDEEWELLDEIEIEVSVENTNKDDKVRDVVVEVKILDSNGNDVTDDFDLDDDKIDVGSIKDDDEETVTFVIPEVPVDLDEDDYRIYVVAYSEDDNQCISYGNDLDDYGSSKYYADVSVVRDDDRGIMIKDLTKIDVVCGQTVEVPLELYNIGDEKEEKVLVHFQNNELGIDEKVIIDDFRDGKKRDLVFRFNMPTGLQKSYYTLDITTYYDWDDDEDELDLSAYDENSEDDLDENYGVRLDVLSCDNTPDNSNSNQPIVNADLVTDEVQVGSDVVIKVMVTNPTSEPQNYIVSIGGYNSWATLVSLQPSSLTVAAGDTSEALVTFNPTTSGVQTFNVRVLGTDADVSQDVSLNVNQGSSSNLWNFGDLKEDANLLYWIAVGLVILIIVLIIIILVVAFRRR